MISKEVLSPDNVRALHGNRCFADTSSILVAWRDMLFRMKEVLVIDVGGTNVKVSSTSQRVPLKIPSGPTLTAKMMVEQVKQATRSWKYDCVSIGYPGPVSHDHPLAEPHNLAPGWIDFQYKKSFNKPLRFINDAAMQALGGYRGGRMLFLGTGTGLGSAMIYEGVVVPLELAHLPYRKGRTYEEYLGKEGLEERGKKEWRKSVLDVIARLQAALVCDYVLLGGGNAKLMKDLPAHVILGDNSNAVLGGIRLWDTTNERKVLVALRKDDDILTAPKAVANGAGRGGIVRRSS